jgi:hypothetical protein
MKKTSLLFVILLSSLIGFGQSLPDNILENECNAPLPGTPWNIHLLYSSFENDIASYSPLLAGDIDNNGVIDIVVARYSDNFYHSNGMYVFSGQDLSVQSSFNLPDTIYNYNGYAIGRYPLENGTLQGAIFVHSYDKRIRAYAINGTLLNVSDRPTSCDGMISLADFNGDGYPEIYSGNDIFDAATLKWLCSGPSNGNRGLGFRGPPLHTAVNTHHTYYAMSLAYDIFGDAKQELICGNTIYDVNITSRTNPALNAVTENKTISPPIGFSQDGHVLVADFDLDGQDEVLVLRDDTDDHTLGNCYIYAYKPTTGHILFQKSHYAYCTSYPLIGNIDDDPYPEIVLLEKQLYSPAKMFCWRFTQQSGLTTVWEQEHNDSSGQTGLTLFDFNQDGIMEIVYRDNRNMRILNGSGKSHVTGNDTIRPYDLYNRMMSAGTGVEYPIVADVNNDGHAEIVATGLLGSTQEVGYGGIHVFGNPGNWSPARPVWNQYMYHVTNVNEDLTVPTQCFEKATVFTGSDGVVRRPYNNFLQQATYITPTGEPVGTQGEPQLVDIYGELNGQYVWNGTIYTQPGNYTQSFTDINGCDSIVTLHLTYPLNYPDNILEDNCNAPLQGSTWDVHLLYSTPGTPVASYAPILAGDIDGNGVVDIVMAHYNGNNYRTKTLDIYSGLDLSLQYRFNIQDSIYVSNGPYALGKYIKDDGTQQGAIFVHGYDKRIRSYTINGTLLNVSDRATSCDGMVSLADFNGDGYPEVYVGNDIFDAATLKWLCSGPEDGNKGLSFRGAAVGVVNHHRCYFAMSHASNVLGDERQELICGNTIYNVDIVSRTNPNLNSITVTKTITPPNGYPNDGHVSLADLDLDGECEVLVIRDHTDDHTYGTTYFYAYRPSDEHILFQNTVQCLCTGYPLVGNIDDDPHPEIVFLEKQSYNPMYLYCWRYTSQNGLSTVWRQPHNDTSGQTGITLFDFNQDNIMELVYRDSESLRIINGSGKSHLTGNDTICPYNLYSRRMAAGTGVEYPTIADINGDGSAEIVASGLLDQSANLPGNGGIHVFGNPGNWSPARPVWNQYMYHVTNVNEDLTIPTYCFDKATVFTDSNGFIRRPYNNFLQQAGYITPTGEPYNPSSYVVAEHFGVGCASYTYQNTTYTESGDYEYLIENPLGCDTLMTVHVQIGDTIHAIQYKSACAPYIWNGTTYNETGVYEQTLTSAQGCDSIVTLYLTVENQIYTNVAVSTCDSYVWNGMTYNESGIYTQAFPSAQDCDSIVTLDLTIKNSAQVSSIHGENLIYYQDDGIYTYSIDTVPGCFGYEWSLDGPWDLDASPDSPVCSIDINSFGSAKLKVRVYTECGFTERSLYIKHDARPDVVVYPNPTKGEFNIVLYGMKGEAVIVVYDYLGQFIDRFSVDTDVEGTVIPYSLAGKAAGVYLISVMNYFDMVTRKVIKSTPASFGLSFW